MNQHTDERLGTGLTWRDDGTLALTVILIVVVAQFDAPYRADAPRPQRPPPVEATTLTVRSTDVGLPALEAITTAVPVRIVRQPSDIAPARYCAEWPWMAALFEQDGATPPSDAVLLERLASLGAPPDRQPGVWNIQAQLARRAGRMSEAHELAERARDDDPDQHLHHYQAALIAMAELSRTENPLLQWRYASRMKTAYERAFACQPTVSAYRQYLCHALQQTPRGFGGDPDRALRLADEGVAMGDDAFLVVRAELRLARRESTPAFRDLDEACRLGVFRSTAFIAGVDAALAARDLERARRYAGFLLGVNPRYAGNWLAAGRVCEAEGRRDAARTCYQQARHLAPDSGRVRRALESLGNKDEG